MDNLQIYESERVVRNYARNYHGLKPAEKVIMEEVSRLPRRHRMLDLGTGAGRTTEHFAPLFEYYLGLDFSAGMIDACRKKYAGMTHAHFARQDVTTLGTDMPGFDFILFSLNGIDYLRTLDDRKKLLDTLSALLTPGGLFAFSTHTVTALNKLYSFQLPRRNPLRLFTEMIRYRKLREINGPRNNFSGKKFFQLYDGGEDFGALTAYILPSFQAQLLKEAGFKNLRFFDIRGRELQSGQIDSCGDNWIHYLCKKN